MGEIGVRLVKHFKDNLSARAIYRRVRIKFYPAQFNSDLSVASIFTSL